MAADRVGVGLLGEDDNGATDLGTLEKKLVEKHQQSRQTSQAASDPISPQPTASARDGSASTPHSSLASPEPAKDSEKVRSATPEKESQEDDREEVAELSEMMCSLVTNINGETRYIGMSRRLRYDSVRVTNALKVHRLDSPYFRPRACSGSTKRWGTRRFSK